MLAPSTIDERFGRGTTETETARLAEFALPIPEANFVRRRIRVRGVVQGVGYRPFIFRLAAEEQLAGWVTNDSEGVVAEVEGDPDHIERLLARLTKEWPPLARVDAVESVAIKAADARDMARQREFVIRPSEQGAEARTGIPADAATCPDCLHELFDSDDRRHGYPFLNCTNCGPRFTLTRSIPYDRPQTSMANFRMCPECQREYDDPHDRRFHAQPNACAVCGPRLEFVDTAGVGLVATPASPLEETIARLQCGEIIAIKGVGGFHLAVDAENAAAVRRLRERKHRSAKPFAVMVKDEDAAARLCRISEPERRLLTGVERPIVLMRKSESNARDANNGVRIAAEVAPGLPWLGVFLPYAPLHNLLFVDGRLKALVMTSANLSDEPICIDNDEARERLAGIADGFLLHNREILQRCDDSIMVVVAGEPQIVRRARGFVPLAVQLPIAARPLLAVGGQMKCAFTLARGNEAFQSQHLGDLEHLAGMGFFESALAHLQKTFNVQPECVVHDMHPDYRSTQWALERAANCGIMHMAVQHHHAHIAACMAEHDVTDQVIGIALDGTGFGSDGSVWGGEVLVADLCEFHRVGHLRAVPMPGGAKAVEQPWRMALSAVWTLLGEDTALELTWPGCDEKPLLAWMRRGPAGPLTSSCGRLFDAVAALVTGRSRIDYEAEAAIELEGLADDGEWGSYTIDVGSSKDGWLIDPGAMLKELLEERRAGVSAAVMSARFHAWVARSFALVAHHARESTSLNRVCLSGGTMHNRLLTQLLKRELNAMGFDVLLHRDVSPGDGGLSYGQAAVAAARMWQTVLSTTRFSETVGPSAHDHWPDC
jgi:hydrogenase maturation protein HypF